MDHSKSLSERLAEFALAVHFENLSDQTVHSVKRLVLDSLGCALGAVGCGPVDLLKGVAEPAFGQASATLIGSGERMSLGSAVLVNSGLTRYLDFNDVYWARDVCHPSDNIPLALACTEASNGSGRQLIEAIVVGYEAQIRLAESFSFQDMGMHHVSAAGFVAPLVIGKVWGLGAEPLAHALALGGYHQITLSALADGTVSMAKSLGYGLPSMSAILTTRLAASGFTGPLRLLEGLWAGANSKDPTPLSDLFDFSAPAARVNQVSLKLFPVQYTLQAPVQAAIELHKTLGADIATIKEILIGVKEDTRLRTADAAKFSPRNRETADHSLPCCVAMALLDGRLHHEQFESDRWAAADVLAVMQKIRVETDVQLEARFPTGRPAKITLLLDDGRTFEIAIEVPLGDITLPLSDTQLQEKFLSLAVPVLGAARAASAIENVMALEKLTDLSGLMNLMSSS